MLSANKLQDNQEAGNYESGVRMRQNKTGYSSQNGAGLMEGLPAPGGLCSVTTRISGFRIELQQSGILIA